MSFASDRAEYLGAKAWAERRGSASVSHRIAATNSMIRRCMEMQTITPKLSKKYRDAEFRYRAQLAGYRAGNWG